MMRGAEVLIVGLGRALSAALALIGIAVLTRLLPPEEYVLIVLLTAFSSFAGLVLINPAGQWVNRHIHEWHDNKVLSARLSELLRLVLVASVAVGCLSVAWYLLAMDAYIAEAVGVGIAVAAMVNFSTAALTVASALNSLGHRREAVVWQLATNGLGLLLAAAFVQADAIAALWLAGLALGAALAFLGARAELRRVVAVVPYSRATEGARRQPFFFEAEFMRYALPLTIVTALMWLEGNGFRFVLERFWSARDLGLFVMALSVPAQLTAVMESFVMQFAYPYFFRNLAGIDDKKKMASVTSAMTGALLPLYWIWGASLFLLAPQFLFLVAGPAYHGAAEWIAVGVLLEVARLTGSAWLLSSQTNMDFRPMIGPFAVGAVGSLLTSLLVAAFGGPVIVIAAGLVAAAVLKALFIVVRARRLLAVRVPPARVGAAGLLLAAGLAAYGPLAYNHGTWISLAILLGTSTAALVLGYLHLHTARDFRVLLQQKLG